ncbi:AMP-binding protein, partial [Kitasatospora sp. NPDC001574]
MTGQHTAGRRIAPADWNDTAQELPGTSATLTGLLADQAARTPDRTALIFEDTELSYAELDTRAERLAARLRLHGAGPDRLVALTVPRSVELVVALLAVLRTGAAYLPVDPDYPADRIAYLLDDAAPVLLLSHSTVGHPAGAGVPTLVLDELPETDGTPDGASTGAPAGAHGGPGAPSPADAAYVIYTSGSTGRPKGVVVRHAGFANLLAFHRTETVTVAEQARPGRRFTFAQTASLSFDTSLEALLWMVAGHELHVLDDDLRRDAAAVVRHLARTGADVLDITPGHAERLVEEGLLTVCPPALVMVGGEALGQSLWSVLAAAPDTAVLNVYGPTECTVDALYHRLTADGRPLIGTRVQAVKSRRNGASRTAGAPYRPRRAVAA